MDSFTIAPSERGRGHPKKTEVFIVIMIFELFFIILVFCLRRAAQFASMSFAM